MPICNNCGVEIAEGIAFCPKCGTRVNAGQQPQGQPAPAQPMPSVPQQVNTTPKENTVQLDLGKDFTAAFTAEDISENKILALTAYLFGVFGFLFGMIGVVVAYLGGKNSPYARFHARQALLLSAVQILLILIVVVMCWTVLIPIVPLIILIAEGAAFVALFILYIIAIVNVFRGKAKVVPLIGSLKLFN